MCQVLPEVVRIFWYMMVIYIRGADRLQIAIQNELSVPCDRNFSILEIADWKLNRQCNKNNYALSESTITFVWNSMSEELAVPVSNYRVKISVILTVVKILFSLQNGKRIAGKYNAQLKSGISHFFSGIATIFMELPLLDEWQLFYRICNYFWQLATKFLEFQL